MDNLLFRRPLLGSDTLRLEVPGATGVLEGSDRGMREGGNKTGSVIKSLAGNALQICHTATHFGSPSAFILKRLIKGVKRRLGGAYATLLVIFSAVWAQMAAPPFSPLAPPSCSISCKRQCLHVCKLIILKFTMYCSNRPHTHTHAPELCLALEMSARLVLLASLALSLSRSHWSLFKTTNDGGGRGGRHVCRYCRDLVQHMAAKCRFTVEPVQFVDVAMLVLMRVLMLVVMDCRRVKLLLEFGEKSKGVPTSITR